MCPPFAVIRARNWFCALSAARVQLRMSSSVATPPAAATFAASEVACSTTMKRWAVDTAVRTPRTPSQPASSTGVTTGEAECAPAPPRRSTPRTAPATTTRSAVLRDRRINIEAKVGGARDGLDEAGSRRDHRGIVGAELEPREASVRKGLAQRRVRRHSPDNGDPVEPGHLDALANPRRESADDCALVRRRKVGLPSFRLLLSQASHRIEKGGLEPGEREVEPRHPRDREGECLRVSLARHPVDPRAAGVAEAEQPRPLVERLAGRVVEGRAQPFRDSALTDGQQQRVPAAG